MKRAVDVLLAAVLLLAACPLLAAVSLAVRLSSPGPIIHRARRAGLDGRLFTIFKFRTMVQHADLIGPGITPARDPRLTPVGGPLRCTKLDELPQLWNVLRGEMSLVGPRPEDPRFVALYTPEQRRVLSVRPGLTGPAQLVFCHQEASLATDDPETAYLRDILPRKLAIDLEYVERHSLFGDLRILARTFIMLGCRPLLALEPLLLLGLAPLLLYPWRWPAATALAAGLIPITWLLRRRALGRFSRPTRYDLPLALLLLATGLGTLAVVDWRLALPKLCGVVLGLALLYAIANAVQNPGTVWLASAGFSLGGLAIALAGLVGTEWATYKFRALEPIYGHLPTVLHGAIPGTLRGTILPNQLAGTLLLPTLVSLGLLAAPWRAGGPGPWLRGGLAIGFLVMLGVLVLTQSRTANAAFLVGCLLIAARLVGRSRTRFGVVRGAALVGAIGGGLALGGVAAGVLTEWGFRVPTNLRESFEQRAELWQLSLAMARDFPATGIGLGHFDLRLYSAYPPRLIAAGTPLAHAHNLFIQAALDFGLLGALALAAATLGYVRNCADLLRSPSAAARGLGTGLAAALAAFLTYGLADAIPLGARPALVIWAAFGLAAGAAAIYSPARAAGPGERGHREGRVPEGVGGAPIKARPSRSERDP